MAQRGKGCVKANERGIGKPLPDKIVRIFVSSDPDATDSSSNEEEYDPWRRIPCMRAPPLKSKPPKKESVTVYMYKKENKNKSKTKWSYRPRTTFPEFPGARLRPWGTWISEIKDPFQNKRIWLGTYDTAEEASRIHLAKKREFEEKKLAQAGLKCSQGSESAGTSSSTPSRNEEAEKGKNLDPES